MDCRTQKALGVFTSRLAEIPQVEALWVAGSLATGDYVPGVSDLDLVALVRGPPSGGLTARLARLHRELDAGPAAGLDLGCQYADRASLADPDVDCPTWTHGDLVGRGISLVTRVELVLHGFALAGRPPHDVLPPETRALIQAAGQRELLGYWSWAARRPQMFWRHPVMVDLGLTAMARARHSISRGELLTKSAAIEQTRAPAWLKDDLRARRRGEKVVSPRWPSALIAWQDVRRTATKRRVAQLERRGS